MGLFDLLMNNVSTDSATTPAAAKADIPAFDVYVRNAEEVDYKVLDSVMRACFQVYAVAYNLERSGHIDLYKPLYSASDINHDLIDVWYSIKAENGMVLDPCTRELVAISGYEDIAQYAKAYFEVYGKPGSDFVSEEDSCEQFKAAQKTFSESVAVVRSACEVLSNSGVL